MLPRVVYYMYMTRRCFIAFPLPSEVKKAALSIQNKLMAISGPASVSWGDEPRMHITIEFLGDLDDALVETVKGILDLISKSLKRFDFEFSGVGGFPNSKRPHILIVDVKNESGEAAMIQSVIRRELEDIGLALDFRHWHPHITLGRVKGVWKEKGISDIKIPSIKWTADKIVFYESRPSSDRHEYFPIAEYRLG